MKARFNQFEIRTSDDELKYICPKAVSSEEIGRITKRLQLTGFIGNILTLKNKEINPTRGARKYPSPIL